VKVSTHALATKLMVLVFFYSREPMAVTTFCAY